jgi:hypothetical protein
MSIDMSPDDRLLLDRMIQENGSEDNTAKIRALQHSRPLEADVRAYMALSQTHGRLARSNPDTFKAKARKRCAFAYKNYTNIFNKMVSGELDMDILFKFIMILREIETGRVDQNEASVKVGTILKELYVDSALRAEEKDKAAMRRRKRNRKRKGAGKAPTGKTSGASTAPAPAPSGLSWADYKAIEST